jgi:hypothetical protein
LDKDLQRKIELKRRRLAELQAAIDPAGAPAYTSWAQIARALGTNDRRLRQWRARPEWPLPADLTPTRITAEHIERVRTWAASLQENRAASVATQPEDEELRDIAAKLKLSQKRLHDLKRDILAGQYVDRQVHERALHALADMFVAQLNALEQALPLALADMDAGQREKEISERFAHARRELAHRVQDELAIAATRDTTQTRKRGRGRPPKKR